MSSYEAGSSQLLFSSLHIRIGQLSNFVLVILPKSEIGIEIAINRFPYAFVYYHRSISSRLLTRYQFTSPRPGNATMETE